MQDLKALNRRWFEEVWNRGNTAVIDEMVAQVVDIHGLSTSPMKTISDFKAFYKLYRAAFSNITVIVDDVLQEGDKSACRITFHAKHTGDALGFPATGRDIILHALVLVRWENGRIRESYNQFDQLGLLRQLGQETRSVTLE